MIGLENKDSSFFTVESLDFESKDTDFSKDLISLSITEKMGGLPQGSLSFYDPKHRYSRILRTGAKLVISWGYKKNLQELPSLIEQKLNFDEVSGDLVRRGYRGFVSSPTGKAGSDGVVTFDCNFSAFGYLGEDESVFYKTGNRASVIFKAMDKINIKYKYIDFTTGEDNVTADKWVRQDETTFAFLNRMAIEWQAVFGVYYTPKGEFIGLFVDNNKIGKLNEIRPLLGQMGGSYILGYKGEINNVISYSWTSSEAESGVGDNVQVDIVDGKIIFRRYSAEQEKVVTWRLNQKKIQEDFQDAGTEDLAAQARLATDLLSKNDFESIKHYFTSVERTTAPNGYGYRIKCEMIGNPLCIPGGIVKINNGFPGRLGGKQSIWYMQSVNHNISRSGYMMSIEVIDVFNLSPVGLAAR